MDLYDTIRTRLGFTDPNNLLDERVYSPSELEDDLVDLDWELRDTKEQIDIRDEEYHEKLREADTAPAWEEDLLLEEADMIEQDRQDLIATYRDRHDLKRMLKGIKSTRRRLRNSLDLNVSDPIERADRSEVGSILRQELRKKGLNDDKVQEVTEMLTKARDRQNERGGRKKQNLQKHRDRMETLSETPEDERESLLSDADRDEEDSRSSSRATARAEVRRD
jgi:hypothetical protein